jgi:hypothetical protein
MGYMNRRNQSESTNDIAHCDADTRAPQGPNALLPQCYPGPPVSRSSLPAEAPRLRLGFVLWPARLTTWPRTEVRLTMLSSMHAHAT